MATPVYNETPEIDEFLRSEAGYSEDQVNNMEPRDKVDAWLEYNGIIGFTDDILVLISEVYGYQLE